MKYLSLIAVALLLSLSSACHNRQYVNETRDRGVGEILPDENPTLDFTGTYEITEMDFDTDPDEEVTTNSTVSTVLRNVHVTENGIDKFKQAMIKRGVLKLEDSEYKISYEIINGSNQVEKVGLFSEGVQTGIYALISSGPDSALLMFYPDGDQDSGFADANYGPSYKAIFELNSLYVTTDTSATDGSYLTGIKASRTN